MTSSPALVPTGSRFPNPVLVTSSRRKEGTSDTSRQSTRNRSAHIEEQIERSRRSARVEACPRCSARVLTGPDHDRVALIVRVDADPVDAVHEAVAILTGRASFDLVGRALCHREPWHYLDPARRYPVMIEHRCERGERDTSAA